MREKRRSSSRSCKTGSGLWFLMEGCVQRRTQKLRLFPVTSPWSASERRVIAPRAYRSKQWKM